MAGIWRVSGQKNPFKSVHFSDPSMTLLSPSSSQHWPPLAWHACPTWCCTWQWHVGRLPGSCPGPKSCLSQAPGPPRLNHGEAWLATVHGSPTHTYTHTHLLRTVIANSVVERIWRAKPDRNRRVFGVESKENSFVATLKNGIKSISQEEPHNISRKLQWTRDSPQPQSVSFV